MCRSMLQPELLSVTRKQERSDYYQLQSLLNYLMLVCIHPLQYDQFLVGITQAQRKELFIPLQCNMF